MQIKTDIAILGGGLLGSSVAMHLVDTKRPTRASDVTVFDIDLEGSLSSSELNAGGVRCTWNHPINIEIAKASIEYFGSVADEVGFRQRGYFWMYSKEDWKKSAPHLRKQSECYGLGVEFLTPSDVSRKHGFIDKTSDLGGATFSPLDGLLNPNLLKLHYRARASQGGARFQDRIWINRIELMEKRIRLFGKKYSEKLDGAAREKIMTEGASEPLVTDDVVIDCEVLVNCTGAWAGNVQEMLGEKRRSKAIRRQVSLFECRGVDLSKYGMFVDSSGVYFHTEAQYVLSGFAVESEPEGYNFHYDGTAFFEEYIWPALYERSSQFESLKHVTGWAGLYEISPDRCGILGQVGSRSNVFEAHSFSGRGVMQSWAAGMGLAELILNGRFESIDLTPMSGDRFTKGQLIDENLLI